MSLAVGITWALRTFVVDTVSVASGSMEPTLAVGNHYLVNRMIYRLRRPRRGEIVVFRSPVDQETGFIKRVIAVAGDEVELRDKKVFLNGTLLEEPYTIYKRAGERLIGDNLGPLKVPEDSLFMLGDDRDESDDSTTWREPKTGKRIYFLPTENVKGRLMQLL